MKNIYVLILIVFTASLIFLGINLNSSSDIDDTQFYPLWNSSVVENKSGLNGIKIYDKAGQLIIHAQLDNNIWRMVNAANYPVDLNQVSSWYKSILAAKNIEPKTESADKYFKLGLDVNSDDIEERPNLIKLDFEQTQFEFYLGNVASSAKGSYIKLVSNPQTWLLDQNINLPEDNIDWLNTSLFSFNTKDIKSLSFESVEADQAKQSWTLSSSQEPEQDLTYSLSLIPEGYELNNQQKIIDYFTDIKSLNFESVFDYDTELFSAPNILIKIELLDGKNLTLMAKQQAEDYYLYIQSDDNPKQQAWHFKISEYDYGRLNKPVTDLLSEIVKPDVEG